jgi:tetratricopeptide (TPR) repeat protein
MNKWRVAGLVIVAALAGWLGLRSCMPQKPATVTEPKAPREEFHASKPLRVVVRSAAASPDQTNAAADADEWLDRELRNLLIRGRMQVAPIVPSLPDGKPNPFTLQIELPADGQSAAKITLLAPGGEVSRQTEVALGAKDRLALILELAKQLPDFLGAANTGADWGQFVGMTDAAMYENFIRSSSELLGSHGHGFTQPTAADRSRAVQRLEAITRKAPQTARAWSLLSIGYLNLGGQDQASLTRIAESSAERALALDPAQADAQSALGLVRMRRGEWGAATEYFDAALALDANAIAALEGSACLLMDVGQPRAAAPVAQRAVALQPDNVGANTCLAYAQLATDSASDATDHDPLPVARVKALAAVLSGDNAAAQRNLGSAAVDQRDSEWMDPLLRATTDRHQRSEAVRAITLAASNGSIDASTEILGGAALHQSDFVFNRMLRLHKQNQPVPLRILWLPQTAFLRTHRGFEDIVSAAGLLPFWQDHGPPDVCAKEREIYGCKLGKKR